MTPSPLAWLAESRLQRASEDGIFDSLARSGDPLILQDELLIPEGWRLAFRVLGSAGLAPLWIEIDKEVDIRWSELRRALRLAASLGESSPAWQPALQQARIELDCLNRLIQDRNLRCPWRLQRPGLKLESETRRALGASESAGADLQGR